MTVITTISYEKLSELLKNQKVTLNNERLIVGRDYKVIRDYLEEVLGTSGYVIALKGKINPTSVSLLSKLDRGLKSDKVIIEASLNPREAITYNVQDFTKIGEFLNYGLDSDTVIDYMEEAKNNVTDSSIQVVCFPCLEKAGKLRISSLSNELEFESDDITVVKMPQKR